MATEQLLKPHHPEHVQPDVRGARHLADARLVLPGGDRPSATPERDERRFLTTILMTDIVDSTHTAACLGDRRWCDLLNEHCADCGALVARGRGQLVTTTGDGIVATFDTPACAVRAAIAIQEAARQFAIAVRAGVPYRGMRAAWRWAGRNRRSHHRTNLCARRSRRGPDDGHGA